MSLGDAAMKSGSSDGELGKPIAVKLAVEPLDTKTAASRIMVALHAHDVEALDDALRLHHQLCEDEYGQNPSQEDGPDPPY